MNIIYSKPSLNGAFPCIQNTDILPENCYEVVCDTAIFYDYNGYVNLDITGGKVTGFTPNIEAWEQWQAEHTEPIPQMTTQEAILDKLTEIEYRQDLIELGLTEGGI